MRKFANTLQIYLPFVFRRCMCNRNCKFDLQVIQRIARYIIAASKISTLKIKHAFVDPISTVWQFRTDVGTRGICIWQRAEEPPRGSSLIQVRLRGLLRKCFNCGVGQHSDVYNVHTSRMKSTLWISTIILVLRVFYEKWKHFIHELIFVWFKNIIVV